MAQSSPHQNVAPRGTRPAARVLVVEDDPHIRDILAAALGDEGYEVRLATHGGEALSVLRVWPAGVILLDLMLPVMDGWTFLAERQRHGVAPESRVIVLSAARTARIEDLRHLGADTVIRKPFDLDQLFDALEQQTRNG